MSSAAISTSAILSLKVESRNVQSCSFNEKEKYKKVKKILQAENYKMWHNISSFVFPELIHYFGNDVPYVKSINKLKEH